MSNSRMFKGATTLAVFFLSYCNVYAATDSIVAHIKSKPLSQQDFKLFCQAQHLDSARVALAIKQKVYNPEDQSCGADIPVFGRIKFNYNQIEKSLHKETTLKSLISYTATLYKLIAEPAVLGGAKAHKNINYTNPKINCKSLFDSLSTATWAFDCGGHAEMAKVFLDSFGHKKYMAKAVQLFRKNGDEVNHIVTLVYYCENNQWYGIALDCQNGMLGPVIKGGDSIPSITAQKASLKSNQADKYQITSIPDSDLHNKRNLMDDAFYCNILPDKQNKYHLAYTQSGYKYERLTYSMLYYSWFKAGVINANKYEQDLVRLLVKNAPPN